MLSHGVEFFTGAKEFIRDSTKKVSEETNEEELETLCQNLGLAIRAAIGFAVLSANNDALLEGLALISQLERQCPQHGPKIFDSIKGHLKTFLSYIRDQYVKKNNYRYLDTTKASGVFSIAKFVSFAQQTEHNTSIASDGEYLYMFVAIP